MRDIKFRVWDTVENKYHYKGKLDNGDIIVIHLDSRIEISDHETYRPKDFILEQYTGLKDKNGVEIYEGDIIKLEKHWDKPNKKPTIGKVLFYELCYRIRLNDGHTIIMINSELEIIGNIHGATND